MDITLDENKDVLSEQHDSVALREMPALNQFLYKKNPCMQTVYLIAYTKHLGPFH